jgi:hypothetical protein
MFPGDFASLKMPTYDNGDGDDDVMFAGEYQSFETAVEYSISACTDIVCMHCAHLRAVFK